MVRSAFRIDSISRSCSRTTPIPDVTPVDPQLPQIKIAGPTTAEPGQIVLLDAKGSTKADHFAWSLDLDGQHADLLPIADGFQCVVASRPGTHVVTVAAGNQHGLATKRYTFTVENGPAPNPPDPNPKPDPSPTPAPGGISVLILEDTAAQPKLDKGQIAVLESNQVRSYLDAHCRKVNNQPQWKILDASVDVSNASDFWKAAVKQPHDSLPWIFITTGSKGYSGPLPKSEADALTLLKKWGGD